MPILSSLVLLRYDPFAIGANFDADVNFFPFMLSTAPVHWRIKQQYHLTTSGMAWDHNNKNTARNTKRIMQHNLHLKAKLRGHLPLANYTDRATAACRRS
jgi:hypothetical protein